MSDDEPPSAIPASALDRLLFSLRVAIRELRRRRNNLQRRGGDAAYLVDLAVAIAVLERLAALLEAIAGMDSV